jgi:hypothetical protein
MDVGKYGYTDRSWRRVERSIKELREVRKVNRGGIVDSFEDTRGVEMPRGFGVGAVSVRHGKAYSAMSLPWSALLCLVVGDPLHCN